VPVDAPAPERFIAVFVAYWLVGAAVMVYGAIGLAIVAGLFASYLSWRRDERDDVAPTARTL